MRVGITGSRSITDERYVAQCIESVIRKSMGGRDQSSHEGGTEGTAHALPKSVVLLSGGAHGVDEAAIRFARNRGYDHVTFKPAFLVDNKEPYNPRHYLLRNKQIVDNSDVVVAIWDGSSRGTGFTISYARKKGKDLHIFQAHPTALIKVRH